MPTTAPDSDHPRTGLPVLQVAAGVIRNARVGVLIAQRPGNGLWELPGGKFEPGETAYKALVRELHEELGITVTAALPFMRICHRYPDKQVHLHVWQVLDYHGEPHGLDGQPLAWVLPEQLTDYPCLAANVPIIHAIRLNLPQPPSLLARQWPRIGRWIALLLLLAGLIGLGFFIGKQLSHWISALEPNAAGATHLVLSTSCNPMHTICTAHAEKRDLFLSVGVGEEVKPLIPFPVQVQLAGSASQTVRQVAVHFTMSGMDMRLWPMPLHAIANGNGLWQGNAIVPLCTTGRQDWEITVVIRGQEQFVAGPFSFVVQH